MRVNLLVPFYEETGRFDYLIRSNRSHAPILLDALFVIVTVCPNHSIIVVVEDVRAKFGIRLYIS